MTEQEAKKLSKYLSYILRHHPETIGLELDSEGWANVGDLLAKMQASGTPLTMDKLVFIVENNSKKRFAFDETGQKIRASQGHSIGVDLGYTPETPPEILYHGTAAQFLADILATGLQKQSRHHVHLSSDVPTAQSVGQRHGKPVVLEVLAGQMSRDGHTFFLSANGVWLTEHVPPAYLQRLDGSGK
jgi:putative RNA 2'-phosphotransferase